MTKQIKKQTNGNVKINSARQAIAKNPKQSKLELLKKEKIKLETKLINTLNKAKASLHNNDYQKAINHLQTLKEIDYKVNNIYFLRSLDTPVINKEIMRLITDILKLAANNNNLEIIELLEKKGVILTDFFKLLILNFHSSIKTRSFSTIKILENKIKELKINFIKKATEATQHKVDVYIEAIKKIDEWAERGIVITNIENINDEYIILIGFDNTDIISSDESDNSFIASNDESNSRDITISYNTDIISTHLSNNSNTTSGDQSDNTDIISRDIISNDGIDALLCSPEIWLKKEENPENSRVICLLSCEPEDMFIQDIIDHGLEMASEIRKKKSSTREAC